MVYAVVAAFFGPCTGVKDKGTGNQLLFFNNNSRTDVVNLNLNELNELNNKKKYKESNMFKPYDAILTTPV